MKLNPFLLTKYCERVPPNLIVTFDGYLRRIEFGFFDGIKYIIGGGFDHVNWGTYSLAVLGASCEEGLLCFMPSWDQVTNG